MSCNKCNKTSQASCGSCRPRATNSCEQRLTVSQIPGTACTLGVTLDGITDTVELSPMIKNCETKTHLRWNGDKCRLEYSNELYESSNGTQGFIEAITAETIVGCANLEDLANVADTEPENCAMLVYKKDPDCGQGCSGLADMWQPWTPPKVEELAYVGGYNEEGCPVKLQDPSDPETDPLGNNKDCYILTHSGNSSSWYSIPDEGTAQVNGAKVLSMNDNGCIIAKELEYDECIEQGTIVQGYTPNAYSGVWTTPANTGTYGDRKYGPTMGSPSYTNNTGCPQYVRLDAQTYVCSTATNGGPYNVALGLSIKANRNDVNGRKEVFTWDHIIDEAGSNYGSYQRITVTASHHQIVRVEPGQTVSWTVKTFRANFGGTEISNDDGTFAGDPEAAEWTITAWRAA